MKLPLVPTVIVGAAVATMIGLGVWQLRRAEWKEGLLARYEAAQGLPPIAWPAIPPEGDALYYRRASGFCLEVADWRSVAGRNIRNEAGWAHIAQCRTGAEGPGMPVEIGWSRSSKPPQWRGGEVSGVIAPDRKFRIRLVADRPPPGLEQVAPPSPAAVANNHLLYAIQWFLFAVIAAVIYVFALRRRQREGSDKPVPPAA